MILPYRIEELENEKGKRDSLLKEKDSDVTILKTQIQSLVCTTFSILYTSIVKMQILTILFSFYKIPIKLG